MFSPFTSFSNPFSLPRILGGDPGMAVSLAPVEIHDIEIKHEKPARTLKHLLKLNHVNHAIVYHNLEFHNHTPHILGSAYILGAGSDHLNVIYEEEDRELEPWRDSPSEISKYDWRDFLGKPEYQRAFLDFFEDELVLKGYDWRKVVEEYMFQGKEPLVNCLIAGLGHPLIHLGYAYELSSRELAMEALTMTATSYDFLHKYLDDASFTKPSTYSTASPLEILQRVYEDKRFDGLSKHQGPDNIELLFENHEDAVLEHWNAWKISNPKRQFEDSQKAAAALLFGSLRPAHGSYDFFLLHLLTTSHAVRILIPLIPAKFHVPLVRQWWLITITVYIAQLRPIIDSKFITDYDLKGKDWQWVIKQAVVGKHATDAHYVKGLRALKEAGQTWGDPESYFLKAAAKFADEFRGWGGF